MGGAIEYLPILANANLIPSLLEFVSLMLSKATCIWAVTSAGKPSQTTSSHWILTLWCFSMLMAPNIIARQYLHLTCFDPPGDNAPMLDQESY